MARRPREQVPGGVYHVGARGNCKRPIFGDDADRLVFLWRLGRVVARHDWTCLAYCLMTNHFHFALLLGNRGVSAGMQELLSGYSRATNQRYRRCDHLFKQHFYSERKSSESAFLELCRYIVLNPVRAAMCKRPEEWPWSSYRASAGMEFSPPYLATDRLLELFASDPDRARERYRKFVAAGTAPVSDTVARA